MAYSAVPKEQRSLLCVSSYRIHLSKVSLRDRSPVAHLSIEKRAAAFQDNLYQPTTS
eukprot:gene16032-22170_t